MRAGVKAYVQELRNLGAKRVGAYIAHHLYKQLNLDLNDFDAIWIPHYGKNNGQVTSTPQFPCDIHQYTDKGRLDGYPGYLDLNRLMGTKPLEYFTGKEVVNVADKKKDNNPSPWAKESWQWAIENGITDGSRPKDPATREEVAAMIQGAVEGWGI